MDPTADLFPGLASLPTLTAPRLDLRWLEDRDVPDLLGIFGDPEVMRYWSFEPLRDEDAARAFLEDIRRQFRERRLFQWGIARRTDDRIVGTCTLFEIRREHRRAEIGFALGRAYWGQGWMTETLGTLIRFAFEEANLHRLEADADPRNERSLRVLERQGFVREGYRRETFVVGDEIQDSVVLGLLRREWRGFTASR